MPLGLMTVTSSSPFPALNVSTVNRAGAPTLLPVASRPEDLFTQKTVHFGDHKHFLHFFDLCSAWNSIFELPKEISAFEQLSVHLLGK